MLLKIHPDNPQKRVISKICDLLKRGELVIFPTDTQYALGCDIFNHKGIERIFKLKGEVKPLCFMCHDLSQLSDYAQFETNSYKLMKRLFPGPYTFILKATKAVPKALVKNKKTVGIRIPQNNFCKELLQEYGHPIVTTSARFLDMEPLRDPDEIELKYHKHVGAIVHAGICSHDESTIVDLSGEEFKILRRGAGDVSQIEQS